MVNDSSLSAGIGPDGTVFAIAASGNEVYVGGAFTTAGGKPVNHVAKWDGSNWSPLGSGMNGQVNALAFAGNGDLYAAGSFTIAGGVSANRVARWNGSSWSSVGVGLNAPVYSLAISGTTIYAGGDFSMTGSTPGGSIARWNGSSWSIPGFGVTNRVNAIALSGNNVYAGGKFIVAGGDDAAVMAFRIARWNGSSWAAMGSGINSFSGDWEVRGLLLSGGIVYAGGNFTTAGGQPANNIAFWNGFAWSTFGSGMNGTVHALSLAGNGDIYAGGGFTNAAGVTADRIAKWDGTSWAPVGSGTDGTVHALAISDDGTVYAAGNFTTAGGRPASNIARWNGTDWSDLVNIATPTQASNITFSNVRPFQMDVSWTKGNGHRRLVKINTVSSFTAPADGSDPSSNSEYGGSGEQVVYSGIGSSFTVTGLSPGTTYYFQIYEYNNYGQYTLFNTSPATNNPNSSTTTSCNATTVLNTNDSGAGSLRRAIADIDQCGTISFDPIVFATQQTITLTSGTLVIDKHLTIQGPGANRLSISGNETSSVFQIGGVTATLDGLTIRDGSDRGITGGGTVTVSNSMITHNGGSGISGIGRLIVVNSTISNNAHHGIFSDAGCYFPKYVSVNNSTISGNGRTGISNYDGLAEIANSTIVGNRGGILNIADCGASTVRLWNTIVAGNPLSLPDPYGVSGTDIVGDGPAVASYNLIGDAAYSGGIQNGVNGNIVGADPLLGPLQNNGGPTLTHALLAGSPAINAGDNCVLTTNGCGFDHPALTTDQRGKPRNGRVDLGAYERALAAFDFDGDGKADPAVFRPSERNWYVNASGAGFGGFQWGLPSDTVVAADFDGDAKTDAAVFRDGTWWVRKSSGGHYARQWGSPGDKPVPADYDGDGRADQAVYRAGTWWILKSRGGHDAIQWGLPDDQLVPTDYDGDGRADVAVFRDGVWWIRFAKGGFTAIPWGLPSDKPVPADYDGDGRSDLAVYRDGVWWILRSTGGYSAINWGVSDDLPVPADYDGDGRTDPAIFRNGTWWIRKSSGGHGVVSWGLGNDHPLPAH